MTISFLACVVGRRAFFALNEKSSFLMLVSKFLVDRLLMSDKLLLLICCKMHADFVLVDKKTLLISAVATYEIMNRHQSTVEKGKLFRISQLKISFAGNLCQVYGYEIADSIDKLQMNKAKNLH